MPERLNVPKSPDDLRAAKAARQKRWRENAKKKAVVQQAIDYSLGRGPAPTAPLPRGKDLAVILRDRYGEVISGMFDEELLNKDNAPALNVALKAQKIIDEREKVKAKTGNADLAFAIIALVNGSSPAPQIEAPVIIEGESVDIAEAE